MGMRFRKDVMNETACSLLTSGACPRCLLHNLSFHPAVANGGSTTCPCGFAWTERRVYPGPVLGLLYRKVIVSMVRIERGDGA